MIPVPMLTPVQIETFLLVFLRVSAMMVMMPILGDRAVPVRVKGGLALLMALVIAPLVPPVANVDADLLLLVFRMGGEILIGAIIGFSARLVFAGIQLAGEVMGFQMGLSIANVIDPLTNSQTSIISELQYLLAMLLFLGVDAHHVFIAAIAESFRMIEPWGFHFSPGLARLIIDISRDMFIIAVKVSAPFVTVMLLTNVGLAVVARTVPQINIFIVGFPLQIAVGLVFLGLTAPVFVKVLVNLFSGLGGEVHLLLRMMGQGILTLPSGNG